VNIYPVKTSNKRVRQTLSERAGDPATDLRVVCHECRHDTHDEGE